MAKLEIFDGTNWIILGGQTNIALTGAVIGSGSSSIATTLNSSQTMSGSTLNFNWSNNGSFAEYSNYHILQDSNPPSHFIHMVQSGSGSTYRRWLTSYKPGSGSIPNGTYEINFYHAVNGFQYPFKIDTYGSLLRTYFGTTIDMQNNEIINAAYPTTSSSLATRGYADSLITTQLQNLSNIVTTGIMTRTGTNIFATRSLAVGSGLSITNADGVRGNPTINLGAVPISSLSGYPANSSFYLRGDGIWSQIFLNQLPANGNLIYPYNIVSNINVVAYGTVQTNSMTDIGQRYIQSYSPIVITDNYQRYLSGSYGWLNSGGSVSTASSGGYYSLDCRNRVKASEFNAYSSIKKKNILLVNKELVEKEALEIFKKIPFVKYEYKDKLKEGKAITYGIVAEQIDKILPGYVDIDCKDFVPNIMQKCKVLKKETYYEVSFDKEINVDFDSRELRIITQEKMLEVTVIQLEAVKTQFILKDKKDNFEDEEIFVYGTYETCPTVAKNKLFELSMVVVQNLLKRINNLEEILKL